MLARVDQIASDTLGALNRESIEDAGEIRRILDAMKADGTVLHAGLSGRSVMRRGRILDFSDRHIRLKVLSGSFSAEGQVFFLGELGEARYFFATRVSSRTGEEVRCSWPTSIYRSERRCEARNKVQNRLAKVVLANSIVKTVRLLDTSSSGAAIEVHDGWTPRLGERLRFGYEDGRRSFAQVCDRQPLDRSRRSWRVGLSLSETESSATLHEERRGSILPAGHPAWIDISKRGPALSDGGATLQSFQQERVSFANGVGREIVGLVDRVGDQRPDVPIVVIPPAWGSTKESAVGISASVCETFRCAEEGVSVLRYDGTNRRGESYRLPENDRPGCEHLGFTFTGAAADLRAALSFARRLSSGPIIIVSTSLAAVETRHVMASDPDVSGWVSLFGVADLAAALRIVSGGIDYATGLSAGLRFGRRELLGVVADIDATGLDALRARMASFEDARVEMACVRLPVTWIHGSYDGWLDLKRTREVLRAGVRGERRLIEVPAGHRLGDGRLSLATYVAVAEEVAVLALGREVSGRCPSLRQLRALREREILREKDESSKDHQEFWRHYLLGHNDVGGMELLCGTAAYRNFMSDQLAGLALQRGSRVVDLGAGLGGFCRALREKHPGLDVCLVEVDYIREALKRASRSATSSDRRTQVVYDVDLRGNSQLPFQDGAFDRAVLSLVVGYLDNAAGLVQEVRRILEHRGRIVLSALHRDSDVSLLYSDGLIEYATSEARRNLVGNETASFNDVVREFLNDGARLMSLEERGEFRFWDATELRELLLASGFRVLDMRRSLGDPAQAIVCFAERG